MRIISQSALAIAPLRLSIMGGGTDFPSYYKNYTGKVLSTTINKYVYVFTSLRDDSKVIIHNMNKDQFHRFRVHREEVENDGTLYASVLKELDITVGINIYVFSTVQPGSGLGSSSALIVALISSISKLFNIKLSRKELAELSYEIESGLVDGNTGKQDMYAATFGGFNTYKFIDNEVIVSPIEWDMERIDTFFEHFLLINLRTYRDSKYVLKEQNENINKDPNTKKALHNILYLASELEEVIKDTKKSISEVIHHYADSLLAAWENKKKLSSKVTSPFINEIINLCLANNATACKVTGAGNGGHLMVFFQNISSMNDFKSKIKKESRIKVFNFHTESKGVESWLI